MATLPLITYSEGEVKNPVLESFKSSFSRVWLCSQNVSELLCQRPCHALTAHWAKGPKLQFVSILAALPADELLLAGWDFISTAIPRARCTHSLWPELLDGAWIFPPQSHLGAFNVEWLHHHQLMAMPWCFPYGSPKSTSLIGVLRCPSSLSEPDGWAKEVESNSLEPKKTEGLCQLVKDKEGLWWSRPFSKRSKDFGYKKDESQFWERPGPCCYSPAGANSWILKKKIILLLQEPSLAWSWFTEQQTQAFKQWKYKTPKLHFPYPPHY